MDDKELPTRMEWDRIISLTGELEERVESFEWEANKILPELLEILLPESTWKEGETWVNLDTDSDWRVPRPRLEIHARYRDGDPVAIVPVDLVVNHELRREKLEEARRLKEEKTAKAEEWKRDAPKREREELLRRLAELDAKENQKNE